MTNTTLATVLIATTTALSLAITPATALTTQKQNDHCHVTFTKNDLLIQHMQDQLEIITKLDAFERDNDLEKYSSLRAAAEEADNFTLEQGIKVAKLQHQLAHAQTPEQEENFYRQLVKAAPQLDKAYNQLAGIYDKADKNARLEAIEDVLLRETMFITIGELITIGATLDKYDLLDISDGAAFEAEIVANNSTWEEASLELYDFDSEKARQHMATRPALEAFEGIYNQQRIIVEQCLTHLDWTPKENIVPAALDTTKLYDSLPDNKDNKDRTIAWVGGIFGVIGILLAVAAALLPKPIQFF